MPQTDTWSSSSPPYFGMEVPDLEPSTLIHVLFVDESRFSFYHSNGRAQVRWPVGERLVDCCIQGTDFAAQPSWHGCFPSGRIIRADGGGWYCFIHILCRNLLPWTCTHFQRNIVFVHVDVLTGPDSSRQLSYALRNASTRFSYCNTEVHEQVLFIWHCCVFLVWLNQRFTEFELFETKFRVWHSCWELLDADVSTEMTTSRGTTSFHNCLKKWKAWRLLMLSETTSWDGALEHYKRANMYNWGYTPMLMNLTLYKNGNR